MEIIIIAAILAILAVAAFVRLSRPEKPPIDGTREYSVKDEPAALGINFSFACPQYWEERPNADTVKYFSSADGAFKTLSETMTINVITADDRSAGEVEERLFSDEFRKMYAGGAGERVISFETPHVAGKKALRIYSKGEYCGFPVRGVHTFVPFENALLEISRRVKMSSRASLAKTEFERAKKTFLKIDESLVIDPSSRLSAIRPPKGMTDIEELDANNVSRHSFASDASKVRPALEFVCPARWKQISELKGSAVCSLDASVSPLILKTWTFAFEIDFPVPLERLKDAFAEPETYLWLLQKFFPNSEEMRRIKIDGRDAIIFFMKEKRGRENTLTAGCAALCGKSMLLIRVLYKSQLPPEKLAAEMRLDRPLLTRLLSTIKTTDA